MLTILALERACFPAKIAPDRAVGAAHQDMLEPSLRAHTAQVAEVASTS